MLVSSIIQVCYRLQQVLRSGRCESLALVIRGVSIQVSMVVILWAILHVTVIVAAAAVYFQVKFVHILQD